MQDRILGDREKALEESYFRQEEARLLEKLRQKASLDEIAVALRDVLLVDNPELLGRARELGITADTAPAFFLAPLVQVAWAEGKVTKNESEAVLKLARDRGVDDQSPAYAQLRDWLAVRPHDELFDAAVEVLKAGYAVLPRKEREERIERLVDACRTVAEASGTELAHLLGLGTGVSKVEASMLDAINAKLRIRG